MEHDARRQRRSRHSIFNISQSWVPELLSWLLALCFFASIIGIMWAFDGQSAPNWKFGITLGALVSVFATVGTSILMVPMGSAMGELKWIWFLRERPIADFETMDKASHGPGGGLLLLLKRTGGYIAVVGAVLTILQLAIGPFVQQVIQYRSLPQNVTQASIPIATIYDASGSRSGSRTGAIEGGGLDTDISMKAAVMNAALDLSAPSTDFDITPACSTGNCTWPSYQSLAICSTCKDISSELKGKPTNDGTNWTLPNGLSLDVEFYRSNQGLVSLTINNSETNPSLNSIAFPGNRSELSLLDVFVLVGAANYSVSGVETPAYASECLLDVCLQSYSASEINGTFREDLIGDPQILTKPSGDGGPYPSGNFSFQYESSNVLGIYLGDTFSGLVKEYNSLSGNVAFPDPVPQALFLAMNSTAHSLDTLMSNVAKSMTRNMRTRSDAGSPIIGDAALNETFVHIQWAWISLPLAVLFSVLAFLLAVMAQARSRRIPNWKDSSLATLFNGLDTKGRNLANRLGNEGTLEEAAEGLLARIENHDDGWGLRSS